MKTMICLILDCSGSMLERQTDVIGGVNGFIEEQKKLPDPASVAFVRFDTDEDNKARIERFRAMQSLTEVKPLTLEDYKPEGWTPLHDAVGVTITALDQDWKRERPDRAIVVIVTDGKENHSIEYTKAKVKALIKARENSGLWAFIYLGANVDAFEEASAMGISMSNTAGYTSTTRGTKALYATASAAVHEMRTSGATVAHNLGGNIQEDGTLQAPDAIPMAQPVQGTAQATWVPPTSPVTPEAWRPPA